MHLDLFAVGAVEQGVDGFSAHILDRRIQRKAILFAQTQIVHLRHRAFGVVPAAGLDGPFPDGKIPVGQDALFVHPHKGTEAGALFAGTQRIIEREEPGRQVADGDAVLRTGEILAEGHALAADDVHLGHAAGEGKGGLQRVRQTAPDALAQGEAVHHHLHGVLDVLFQRDLLVKIVQVAVDLHAGIASATGGFQLLLLGALTLADDGGKDLKLRPLFQLEDGVHHLVHGLLADDPPADRTVGHAHTGVQKAQVIVDLGHSAHGRTGVVAGGLLVDGNGR